MGITDQLKKYGLSYSLAKTHTGNLVKSILAQHSLIMITNYKIELQIWLIIKSEVYDQIYGLFQTLSDYGHPWFLKHKT